MYPNDYHDAKLLFAERLRKAEADRAHNELVRAAQAYARRNQPEPSGVWQRIRQMLGMRKIAKPNASGDQRAHAH